MITASAQTEDPGNSPDQNENDKEPATNGQEWLFQQFDAIAASNGAGHDRRPDRVFLENIRAAREHRDTQSAHTDTTGDATATGN